MNFIIFVYFIKKNSLERLLTVLYLGHFFKISTGNKSRDHKGHNKYKKMIIRHNVLNKIMASGIPF